MALGAPAVQPAGSSAHLGWPKLAASACMAALAGIGVGAAVTLAFSGAGATGAAGAAGAAAAVVAGASAFTS